MLLREIMTEKVEVLSPETSLHDAAQRKGIAGIIQP